MYNVSNPDCDSDIQLLRSNKKFSTKPITQVAAVPHHQILVSLSGNLHRFFQNILFESRVFLYKLCYLTIANEKFNSVAIASQN